MGFVKAVTIPDSITADMVLEALKDNNIPSYKKDLGVGNYKRITAGYSIYGSEIYVDEDSLDEANDIIVQIYGSEEVSDVKEESDDLVKGNKRFNRRRTIFLCAWLVLVLIGVISMIIVSL